MIECYIGHIFIYVYIMNVFYSTSSITSYIFSFILTDCFENLTFIPSKLYQNRVSAVSPFLFLVLSFLWAWKLLAVSRQFFPSFFPDAKITGTVAAVFKNKRKEIKRKDKCTIRDLRSSLGICIYACIFLIHNHVFYNHHVLLHNGNISVYGLRCRNYHIADCGDAYARTCVSIIQSPCQYPALGRM